MLKSKHLDMRISPDELAAWHRAAQDARLSLSDWIRSRCTDATPPLPTKNDLLCPRCQRLQLPGCANCPASIAANKAE